KEIDLLGGDGRPNGTRLPIGELPVERAARPAAPEAVAVEHRLPQAPSFASADREVLRLIGYSAPPEPPLAGELAALGLYGQAPTAPSADYTAVLQGIDATGKPVLEQPLPPVDQLPTGQWQSGDLFAGWHRIRLPTDVAGGRLDLRVGVRDASG